MLCLSPLQMSNYLYLSPCDTSYCYSFLLEEASTIFSNCIYAITLNFPSKLCLLLTLINKFYAEGTPRFIINYTSTMFN